MCLSSQRCNAMNKNTVQTIIHYPDGAHGFKPGVSMPETTYVAGICPPHYPLPVPKIVAIRVAICEAWAIADDIRRDLEAVQKLIDHERIANSVVSYHGY
jgi:hypothetical protein